MDSFFCFLFKETVYFRLTPLEQLNCIQAITADMTTVSLHNTKEAMTFHPSVHFKSFIIILLAICNFTALFLGDKCKTEYRFCTPTTVKNIAPVH